VTLWQWALLGLGAWLVLSFIIGLGMAAVLGQLSRIPSSFGIDDWIASMPMTREWAAGEAQAADRAEDEEAILVALQR
jgi:hypothetical protein